MGIRRSVITLLLLVTCGIATAGAQAPSSRRTTRTADPYDACLKRATTNAEYSDCGGAELARQEARLAATWRAVLATFRPDSGEIQLDSADIVPKRQALVAEQRAWVRYKDLACRHWLYGNGREGQVLHYPICKVDVIRDRVTELRETFLDAP